jgi:hypothetical protein
MRSLVAIGDSLTIGFQSGAIYKAQHSFPAMIAEALCDKSFKTPKFDDDDGTIGGLPMNLEILLRQLQKEFPLHVKPWNFPFALFTINKWLNTVENFWEKDAGAHYPVLSEVPGNLGVLSFTLQDSFLITPELCHQALRGKNTDEWFLTKQIPVYPFYRAALRTINTAGASMSQLKCVEQIACSEGIENLIIALGPNNCLGAPIDLSITFSQNEDLGKPLHTRNCNLYLPKHFEQLYKQVQKQIRGMQSGVKRVFCTTIPHVMIPPVTRGQGNRDDEGYYEYYTRPWIWDKTFDPDIHPFLRRDQAKLIDSFVDEYNSIIRKIAQDSGWMVVDICSFLDKVAFRRQGGAVSFTWSEPAVEALRINPVTAYLVKDGAPSLDTRYIRLDNRKKGPHQLRAGGLFSLDGVHPTTFCYGLLADEFLKAMISCNVKTVDGSVPALDWNRIVAADTLITDPPLMLRDLRGVLSFLSGRWSGKVLFRMLESMKGSVAQTA